MNIIILSHRRSLNKAEGFIRANKHNNLILVTDAANLDEKFSYLQLISKVYHIKGFDIVNITKKIKQCDSVFCVSENLLPIQSQLESYYGIDNLTPYAAEVLSNKQTFDNFCRSVGLSDYVPKSITPTFHNQLEIFDNKEIFTKPDIGTGSNVFLPDSDQNQPKIEYRRWNNKHHFMKYLKDKNFHNDFFTINKVGIQNDKFNNKPCKIIVQEYHWSETPSVAPIGFIRDGKLNIVTYLKISKTKFGDVLDLNKNPIELHSNSKTTDIAKNLAVWTVPKNEIDKDVHDKIVGFMQTIIDKLKIKDLFYAGPDFHFSNGKLIAIDFNARVGQMMNILDGLESNNIFENIKDGRDPVINEQLLWGASLLKPGVIVSVASLEHIEHNLNYLNTELKPGVVVPEFQNLQNKEFNINLNVSGKSEQELFDNYQQANQLLQNCITY